MTLTAQDLHGVFPALVTPFTEAGAYDPAGMETLVARMFDAGCKGMVPLGGTGEYTAMTPAERLAVVETVVAASKGRGPVVAGVLSPGFGEAVETGLAFKAAGVDAIMLVTPFYVLPTQEGVLEYYRAFHAAVGLPIVLYEIPSKTNVSYAPETVATLAEEGIAIGIKYSNLDVVKFTQVMNAAGDSMAVMGGDDSLLAAHMVLGAPGTILATANLCPRAWVECFGMGQSGDHAGAAALNRALYPMIEAVFSEPNPGALKAALRMAGHDAGPVRRPMRPARPETEARLAAMFDSVPELRDSAPKAQVA